MAKDNCPCMAVLPGLVFYYFGNLLPFFTGGEIKNPVPRYGRGMMEIVYNCVV